MILIIGIDVIGLYLLTSSYLEICADVCVTSVCCRASQLVKGRCVVLEKK